MFKLEPKSPTIKDNQMYYPQQLHHEIDYNTNCNNNVMENTYESNYNHLDSPVNFYTQPNYSFSSNIYAPDVQWNTIPVSNYGHPQNLQREYCVVTDANQNKWSVQHPFFATIPAAPCTPQRVLVEKNETLNTPGASVEVKTNPVYNENQALLPQTNHYKLMLENQDPNYAQLNRNGNASTRQVESETTIAAKNLTNVYNQDHFSEDSESQDSMASEQSGPNLRTTRNRSMRIYKRRGTHEALERTNNTELISMKLRGHQPYDPDTLVNAHGDGDLGAPPSKVRLVDKSTEGRTYEKYQISSNIHALQPKHMISWYIDYLIGENEEITEMSKSFTMPGNIFACDDFYYMDILHKNVGFPTPKFVHWMKCNFPSINLNAMEFFQKEPKMLQNVDPREYWKNKSSHEIIKEVFYHFQEKRISK